MPHWCSSIGVSACGSFNSPGFWLCWSAFTALVEDPGSRVVCGKS